MIEVFLSASVPLPERNQEYFKTADVYLIREAIRALVEVIIPVGRITFGGHPAITPLIALYIKGAGLDRERFSVFQSEYFRSIAPSENADFSNVHFVPSVGKDRDDNLTAMRNKMISSRKFDAAVLIGGMEGLNEELTIFQSLHPHAKILPVPSPGAAAKIIYEAGDYPMSLKNNISFSSLFRRNLLPRKRRLSHLSD